MSDFDSKGRLVPRKRRNVMDMSREDLLAVSKRVLWTGLGLTLAYDGHVLLPTDDYGKHGHRMMHLLLTLGDSPVAVIPCVGDEIDVKLGRPGDASSHPSSWRVSVLRGSCLTWLRRTDGVCYYTVPNEHEMREIERRSAESAASSAPRALPATRIASSSQDASIKEATDDIVAKAMGRAAFDGMSPPLHSKIASGGRPPYPRG